MRDEPYPSRYYPRLEEDIALDMGDMTAGDMSGVATAPLAPLTRETKGLLSALLALYAIVAILFALTSRAEAAPTNSVESAAGQVLTLAGKECAGDMSLAHR